MPCKSEWLPANVATFDEILAKISLRFQKELGKFGMVNVPSDQ